MSSEIPLNSDGDALRNLAKHGSDLSREMLIDFAVDAPDEGMALACAIAAKRQGFNVDVHKNHDGDRWTCNCSIVMIPSYDAIIEIQNRLNELGGPFKSRSDGWGSFGNAKT